MERQIINEGKDEEMVDQLYGKLTGLIQQNKGTAEKKEGKDGEEEDDDEEISSDDDDDENDVSKIKTKLDKVTRVICAHEEDSGTAESKKLAEIEVMNVLKAATLDKKDGSSSDSSSSSMSSDSESDDDDDEDNNSGEDDNSDEEDEEGGEKKKKKKHGDVLYSELSKADRKAQVKKEKKEKRENKVPKHIKKQLLKKNKKK